MFRFGAAKNIIASLDIGTSYARMLVAEKKSGEEKLRILGAGVAPSFGLRKGVIVDSAEAANAVKLAAEEARRSSGVNVKSVWLSVGGAQISASSSRGVVAVSRADQEISPEDIKRALSVAESFSPKNANRELLHIIPRDFRVDQESGIKDPLGMRGLRLEVDALLIECPSAFLKNLFKCAEEADLKAEDYVFSPLAAAGAVLNKRQKELGVMLLNVGGGTTSFIVFEEGVAIHAGILPFGGSNITSDIAIGFRTKLDVAERVKIAYGSCLPERWNKRELIKLSEFGEEEEPVYSRRELAEIIEARFKDIFELLQKELKKIGRAELLPAGVVLIGGSSRIQGLADLAKRELKLPAEIGSLRPLSFEFKKEEDSDFAACLGVIEWASAREKDLFSGGTKVGRGTAPSWLKWFGALLP